MHKKFTGKVAKGVQLGHKFGLATANLALNFETLNLESGVYFVRVEIKPEKLDTKNPTLLSKSSKTHFKKSFHEIFEGILHYGELKTFGREKTCEVHIFDFQQDIYNEILEIEVLKFCRPTEKFRNSDALFTQVEKDILDAKKFFSRQKIYSQWDTFKPSEKKVFNQAAFEKIKNHPRFQEAQNIFIYAPQKNREIDFTEKLMEKFSEKKYYFPVVFGADKGKTRSFLKFYQTEKFSDLEPREFGIFSPKPDKKREFIDPEKYPKNKNLIFVPSVAVDRKGFRLGKGGGFYDQFFLENVWAQNMPRMTVLPKFSVLESIPKNERDISIKEILSL